jgi:hypothetical protein
VVDIQGYLCGRRRCTVPCFRTRREPIHGGSFSTSCLARSGIKVPHTPDAVPDRKTLVSAGHARHIQCWGGWVVPGPYEAGSRVRSATWTYSAAPAHPCARGIPFILNISESWNNPPTSAPHGDCCRHRSGQIDDCPLATRHCLRPLLEAEIINPGRSARLCEIQVRFRCCNGKGRGSTPFSVLHRP